MKPELPDAIRTGVRWAYAIAYGFFPVLIWGAPDWRISAPPIIGMAALQMALFYFGARRNARVSHPSRFERVIWPLGHACILGVYFFVYYQVAVPKKPEMKNEPNKAVELTHTLVTDRACARSAPSACVAHL